MNLELVLNAHYQHAQDRVHQDAVHEKLTPEQKQNRINKRAEYTLAPILAEYRQRIKTSINAKGINGYYVAIGTAFGAGIIAGMQEHTEIAYGIALIPPIPTMRYTHALISSELPDTKYKQLVDKHITLPLLGNKLWSQGGATIAGYGLARTLRLLSQH